MGLITNGYRNGFSPFRSYAGAALTYLNGRSIRNDYLTGRMRGISMNTSRQVGLPMGNLAPHSWMLPQTGGGMSMRVVGDGVLAAALVPSYPMSIDLTGAGDLEATAGLIVSMLLAMAGAGDLSATIEGRLNASVDFTGAGDLDASLSGFGNMLVDLLGAGDLEATIAAYGNMSIDIVVTGTGLSTANVGQAVWSALKASNNEPGTMGEVMNGSFGGGASAADIWAYASRTLTSSSTGITTHPLSYKASTSTVEADPGPGRLRWNNANQLLASFLFIDHITDDGIDTSNFLATLAAGTQLYIQDRDSASNYQRWLIGSIVDEAGWYKLGVTLEDSGGAAFSNNHQLVMAYQSSTVVVGLTPAQSVQLLEIFQRLGLDPTKPLVQTATQISTPDWTLDVTETPGTVTVERQP